MILTVRANGKPAQLVVSIPGDEKVDRPPIKMVLNLENMAIDDGAEIELTLGKTRRLILKELKSDGLPGCLGVRVEHLDGNGIVYAEENPGVF